jgi:hypothetical protein
MSQAGVVASVKTVVGQTFQPEGEFSLYIRCRNSEMSFWTQFQIAIRDGAPAQASRFETGEL